LATYVGGGDFLWANRDDRANGAVGVGSAARLDAGLTVVEVVGVDSAGVTAIVVVVVDVVGDGTTMPDGGNDTTPIDEVRVGPLAWLWGTNTIPRIPMMMKDRETAHHIICEGRFPFRDFTSPNLV
jgi:hypothetical protein